MITHAQILPSLYHPQRQEVVGTIAACTLTARPLQQLAASRQRLAAFPGQSCAAYPALNGGLDEVPPDLHRSVIQAMPPRNLVVVAVPDQLHFEVIMAALQAGQHVPAVKPLVLKVAQALEIKRKACDRGLLVAVEYHKRFDDRSFMAHEAYRAGMFGEFRLGSCWLLEKWYHRHSNSGN